MIYLPTKVKQSLTESITERRERIKFEEREIEQAEIKLGLNYAALLVLEQGEDGLDRESIAEAYGKHFDCPEDEVFEGIVEASRKGWIYLHNQETWEYHVTAKLWRELGY